LHQQFVFKMEEFLKPEKILEKLDLNKKMVAADFGCGSGGWAIPLAKKVKWVFAIDIQQEPLSALRSRMRMERVFNIDPLKGNVEGKTTLISESCDLVLMTNLLFQVDDIKKVLEEGKRVLKKGGKILIVDWIKDNPLTREIEWVDFEKIKEIAKDIGLKLEKEFEAGIYHKALVLVKQ
jgi:ubiquinone/menaquinone biosynthesis C-methylase UbiE